MLWFASISLCCYLCHSITRRPQPRLIPTEFIPVSVRDNPEPRPSSEDPAGKAAEMLLAPESPFNVGHRAVTSF